MADEIDLHDRAANADLIITGEGYLDSQSFNGKVVGGVQSVAARHSKPVAAIVGAADPVVENCIEHVSLVAMFGEEKAMQETQMCIEQAALHLLRQHA